MSLNICIITTGGTIDGADLDRRTSRSSSDAVKWLHAQSNVSIKHVYLMNKDSRLINAYDRKLIVDAINREEINHILITHGTFTICQTGRVIKQSCHLSFKSILLVGAWVPFGEHSSDAGRQMTFALETLRNAPKGVFIAMDDKLWDPDVTEKKEIALGQYRLKSIN